MQSMKRTILQSVDNLIVSLNTQIRSIRQQEVATTQQLASNPSQAKYLLSVERQQKVKEELYLYLLQKREENELSQAFTAYNTRVITAPRGSALPMAPNKKNILLVAFALGLLVPAVIIFMQENMNTKVRGKKDLENLSVPYLGEIPLYSNNKKKKNKSQEKTIVVEEGNRNIINEAFRVLRSNVDFMKNKSDPKAGVQVVSEIDKDGKVKTVPADEKNENSFLKFDKNSSILENFIKNFWSQFKEPTHFRLLRMTFHDYKVNKQAIKDLAEGKKTDVVKEFLKRYEIRPRENKEEQNMNKQETAMAKKETQPQEPLQQSEVQQASQQQQQPQAQQVPQEPQGPRYRYNENMIDWEGLDKIGISKATLEQQGLLDSMLRGYKTNKLVPLTLNIPGVLTAKLDARLSLIPQENGQVGLAVHGIRKEPQLERPYFGFNFSEEDKKNLRETGNMGRAVELNLRGSEYTPCLISIDKNTNELVAVRQEHVYIPQEVSGVRLTDEEIRLLKEGQPVKVEGMTSKAGKEFDATLQYSAERRGLEFIFPKNQVFNEKSIGGVPLSPTQIKMLSEGHTILVEDMKFKNRDGAFSAFVTIDQTTGRPNYTRHNPETGEIYIPKEICNVQLTAEDKEVLRKGQAVYLENMINRKGEEFSAFVKLDMNTGRTMYSRTPDGFNEQQAPRIPAEVYGHVFTAQEKANLQDGKTLLVEGLKNNGQTFSSYLKVNPYSGQLQYFQENPDIRRDTSRRAAQADTAQGQQQEQKKGAKQAV
jgi:hypothetical protein